MCSCFVLFCLVKESFVHCFGTDLDKLCYFVVEAGAFWWRVLLRTCDLSSLLESDDIRAWVELMDAGVVPDPGKSAVLEVALECYRGRFASLAEIEACIANCLFFLKIFAVQRLSGCIYRSFTSMVPQVFVRGSPEVLVAPIVRLCSLIRVNGWISAELKERAPVQLKTLVLEWQSIDVDIHSLELAGVVRL